MGLSLLHPPLCGGWMLMTMPLRQAYADALVHAKRVICFKLLQVASYIQSEPKAPASMRGYTASVLVNEGLNGDRGSPAPRLSEVVVTVRSEVSPVGGSEGRMHIAAGQGVADDGGW
ncbi:hypothetical protein Tco_1222785 [Tanacetum coccineum]